MPASGFYFTTISYFLPSLILFPVINRKPVTIHRFPCKQYPVKNFSPIFSVLFPYFFRDFLHKCKFCPLLLFGQLVSDLTGCKSTLRTQAQTLQRNILCCFMNSCDHLILIFQFRLFGCDQTKYNFLSGDTFASGAKPPDLSSSYSKSSASTCSCANT